MAIFQLYKPTQGKYVRWGTVIAMALIVGLGMYWIGKNLLSPYDLVWKAVGSILYGAIGTAVTFIIVNRPRPRNS